MKKIIALTIVAGLIFAGCKKEDKITTTTEAVSYPTITISGNPYYSILVNGALPTISATAYDSVLHEVCTVLLDQSKLDNTTAGLYAVTASAKNKYGMTAYTTVYVGVTNESASLDLSGTYIRNASPTNVAFVTKLATGMFLTSNVGGDDTVTQAGSVIPAVFVVTSDTTFDFGSQLTSAGTLTASQETLVMGGVGDTVLNYAVSLTGFGTQVRTFVKQ